MKSGCGSGSDGSERFAEVCGVTSSKRGGLSDGLAGFGTHDPGHILQLLTRFRLGVHDCVSGIERPN